MEDNLVGVTKEVLNDKASKVEESSSDFIEISDKVVSGYTNALDDLMHAIWEDTIAQEADDQTLDRYTLELSNALYFIGANLEKVGVKDDITKMSSKQVYNDAYLKYSIGNNGEQKKLTVAELSARAEGDARYDTILNSIYARAYKEIKFKVDAAYEMLSSLRKVITRRMNEQQLSSMRINDNVKIVGE